MKRNISQTNVLESLNEELHSEFALHELDSVWKPTRFLSLDC